MELHLVTNNWLEHARHLSANAWVTVTKLCKHFFSLPSWLWSSCSIWVLFLTKISAYAAILKCDFAAYSIDKISVEEIGNLLQNAKTEFDGLSNICCHLLVTRIYIFIIFHVTLIFCVNFIKLKYLLKCNLYTLKKNHQQFVRKKNRQFFSNESKVNKKYIMFY